MEAFGIWGLTRDHVLMKKKYIVWFPLLVLVTGVMVGIRSAGQPASRPPGTGSSAAPTNMEGYIERAKTALKANTAATNLTDEQVHSLMNDAIKTNLAAELWARQTVQTMRSSQGAHNALVLHLLEDLRAGRTNEVMRRLEYELEANVAGFGSWWDAASQMHLPPQPGYLDTLQTAKDYWRKFPRATGNTNLDGAVKHALSLLDKAP